MNTAKKSNWLTYTLIGLAGYVLLGMISLNLSANNISAKKGTIWANIDRGTQLLPRLEKIVKSEMQERRDLITLITDSRSSIQQARSSGNLAEATSELSNTLSTVKVSLEDNQVSTGVNDLQQSLLTETTGTINRITYAKKNLIEAQTGYNNTRSLFFINGLFTPRQDVLGEYSDVNQPLPETSF